ncbi:MAG: hypothetical protein HY040_16760 [Planctomycetes bacterium]|nr:hypothetical protein [Planctomycetota bacterium]
MAHLPLAICFSVFVSVSASTRQATNPATYCGVQALARAMTMQGRSVPFVDLVKPEFITSKRGSSAADLSRAARHFGFEPYVRGKLSCFVLRNLDRPAILHVKNHPTSGDYNHWVLFAGCSEGKARIYDGSEPLATMNFEELASIWDGTAVIIDTDNSAGLWVLFSSACWYLFLAGLVTALVNLLVFVAPRVPTVGYRWINEVLLIIAVTILCPFLFASLNPGGFLSSEKTLASLREYNRPHFLPHFRLAEAEAWTNEAGNLTIDARLPDSYESGHLPNSINVPYYLSVGEMGDIMNKRPKEQPILVYCESYGCYFSDVVARKLLDLGYHNLFLFREGWQGWERRR